VYELQSKVLQFEIYLNFEPTVWIIWISSQPYNYFNTAYKYLSIEVVMCFEHYTYQLSQ